MRWKYFFSCVSLSSPELFLYRLICYTRHSYMNSTGMERWISVWKQDFDAPSLSGNLMWYKKKIPFEISNGKGKNWKPKKSQSFGKWGIGLAVCFAYPELSEFIATKFNRLNSLFKLLFFIMRLNTQYTPLEIVYRAIAWRRLTTWSRKEESRGAEEK